MSPDDAGCAYASDALLALPLGASRVFARCDQAADRMSLALAATQAAAPACSDELHVDDNRAVSDLNLVDP